MSNIVKASINSKESAELSKMKQIIELSDWKLRIQLISSNLNIGITDALISKKTNIHPDTFVWGLGHQNLESFIESKSTGLGIKWCDWEKDVTALMLNYCHRPPPYARKRRT